MPMKYEKWQNFWKQFNKFISDWSQFDYYRLRSANDDTNASEVHAQQKIKTNERRLTFCKDKMSKRKFFLGGGGGGDFSWGEKIFFGGGGKHCICTLPQDVFNM